MKSFNQDDPHGGLNLISRYCRTGFALIFLILVSVLFAAGQNMDNHLSVSFYLKCQLSAQTLPDEEKYELALIFSITVTDSSTKMSSTSSFCSEQLSAATLDQVVMLEPVPFLFVIFLINLQHVANRNAAFDNGRMQTVTKTDR